MFVFFSSSHVFCEGGCFGHRGGALGCLGHLVSHVRSDVIVFWENEEKDEVVHLFFWALRVCRGGERRGEKMCEGLSALVVPRRDEERRGEKMCDRFFLLLVPRA